MAAEIINLIEDALDGIKKANDKNIKNVIKKDDLRDLLSTTLASVQTSVDILSGEKELWNKTATFCMNYLPKSSSPARDVVKNYLKQLKGKASLAESKGFLLSLLQADMLQLELLNEASNKFNTLIQDDSITLYNTRVSIYLFIYYLQQAELLSNFTNYLVTFIVQAIRHHENDIPKYRIVYLTDHVESVAGIVSDILSNSNKYNIVESIKTLRNRFEDIELNSETNLRYFNIDAFVSMSALVFNGIKALFKWVPKLIYDPLIAFDDFKRHKYEKQKEEKAWLEQHVAMLKMELDGVDKTSPEYIKTSKIIEAYDSKISDYDKKINEFEEQYR